MSEVSATKLDPVKYEIFFSKLDSLLNESQQVVRYLSASTIVREAGEALSAFYLPTGEAVNLACGILMHFMNITRGIQYMTNAKYSEEDIGIYEGDQFINNDAYIGGMHCPDICLVAPFYYEGKLLGYVGAVSHTTEVGGIEPGGMCPSATEAWHDGLIIPYVKIVEKGKIRRDVMNMFLRGTRDARTWELDFKAKLAGNERTMRRLTELVDEFGADFFVAATKALVQEGETLARAKVKQLRPGIYSCRTYCDTLGAGKEKLAVIQIDLEITENGELIVRSPVVSPQQPCFNNAYLPAVEATIMYSLLTQMLWDARWNSGAANILKYDAPLGSRINADQSQSVGYATVGIALVFCAAFTNALSRAYYASGKLDEVQAGGSPSWNDMIVSGRDYLNRPCASLLLSNGHCFPAPGRIDQDGVHNYAFYNPWNHVPDCEGEEAKLPILHLYLGLVPDSAAVGKYRSGYLGGAITMIHNTSEAYTVHDGLGGKMSASQGIFGGYPGPRSWVTTVNDTDIYDRIEKGENLPQNALGINQINEYVSGKVTKHGASVGVLPCKAGDISVRLASSAGGLGDPLERDPELIVADIRDGRATIERCEKIYCVSIDPDNLKVNYEKTKMIRDAMREERLTLGIPGYDFIKNLVEKRREREFSSVVLEFLDELIQFSPAFKQQIEKEEELATKEFGPLGKVEIKEEIMDLTPYIKIIRDVSGRNIFTCSKCGFAYCDTSENYKLYSLIYERDPAEMYPGYLAPDKDWAVYRECYCPDCGVQYEVEQCPPGMTVLQDARIKEI